MQNSEIKEVFGKKVSFTLVDATNVELSSKQMLNDNKEYYVLWYDAKMKNYL